MSADVQQYNRIHMAELLRRGAEASPNQVLLADGASERSGAALAARANALAAGLVRAGLGRGEATIITLGNRIETIEAWWAVVQAGGIAVAVADGDDAALAAICRATGARFAIATAARTAALKAAGIGHGVALGSGVDGWADFAALAEAPEPGPLPSGADQDICALNPGNGDRIGKRSHRAVVTNGAISSFLNGAANHRVVSAVPLAGAALEAVMFSAIICGSPVRICDPTDAPALARAIADWRPTSVMTDAAMAAALAVEADALAPPGTVDPMLWNIIVPAGAMATTAPPAASFANVRHRLVAADPVAGFLAERDAATGAWMPLPTVALDTASGLAIRSPAASVGYPSAPATARDFASGWLTLAGDAPDRAEEAIEAAIERVTAMDVGSLMRRGAQAHRERVFIVEDERRVTFGEVLDRTARLSRGLVEAHGVARGDRVAILMHNRPEWVEAYWAVAQIGAIIVPANFRLSVGELAHILNDCGATLLIAEPEHRPLYDDIAKAVPTLNSILTVTDAPGEESDYEALIAASAPATEFPPISEHEPCSLLYTAGTTGKPKGAIRTHKGVLWFGFTTCIYGLRMSPQGSYLATPPMFHIAGHETSIFACVMRGLKVVTLPRFDAPRVLETVARERITSMFIPPTMGQDMIRAIETGRYALSSLRDWASASAPLPEPLRDAVLRLLPWIRLRNSYGMTEAGGIAAADGKAATEKASTCVGRVAPTAEVRIEASDGTEAEPGAVGEITLRSPQMLTRYWNNAEADAAAFGGGWFHTGDLGRWDDDHDLHIMGRVKDMIISGGENVYAVEVENVLFEMPAIADAALIGLPHPRWGEMVAAVVVAKRDAKSDEESVIAFCRDRIAHYKCPKRVFFADSLPRNAAGKILKQALRAQYAEAEATDRQP